MFVACILKGVIAIVSPQGEVQREIALKGKEPTNLAFGGADGKTVFVAQRKGGFVEYFSILPPFRRRILIDEFVESWRSYVNKVDALGNSTPYEMYRTEQ